MQYHLWSCPCCARRNFQPPALDVVVTLAGRIRVLTSAFVIVLKSNYHPSPVIADRASVGLAAVKLPFVAHLGIDVAVHIRFIDTKLVAPETEVNMLRVVNSVTSDGKTIVAISELMPLRSNVAPSPVIAERSSVAPASAVIESSFTHIGSDVASPVSFMRVN